MQPDYITVQTVRHRSLITYLGFNINPCRICCGEVAMKQITLPVLWLSFASHSTSAPYSSVITPEACPVSMLSHPWFSDEASPVIWHMAGHCVHELL